MKDILITSSVLILAVLVLRRLFRKSVSRRAQYAVWALVLLRLLIPGDLLGAGFSVLSAARPVEQAVSERLDLGPVYLRPTKEVTAQTAQVPISQIPEAGEDRALIIWDQAHERPEGYLVRNSDGQGATLYALRLEPAQVLAIIWKVGMVLMAGFFLISNALFWHKLRKNRAPYAADSAYRVYLVGEGVLPSPCLFLGAIYLTPAAVETPERLRHVLAHEETHARHLDPLWSLLRCVCLAVYWFDPLVWVAAVASRTDCELACDEGALDRLGEDQRIPYGQTLLSLIPVRRGLGNPLLSATTMTSGKRRLKDRITRIAQKPRRFLAALVTAAVLVAVVSACTFTGVSPSPSPAGPTALTGEELRWFNESFFNSAAGDEEYNLHNQFASPIILYDRPENIDLGELLYCEGSTQLTDEECRLAFGVSADELDCAIYKLTTAEIDDILTANTGRGLDELRRSSLRYHYLADYDAYYWAHGDTNYCGELTFTSGETEQTADGPVVRLYRQGWDQTWYCVTLSDQGGGDYWFLSHQTCDAPAIPTTLPEGEPLAVIPLEDSQPCIPQRTTVDLRAADDFVENLGRWDVWGKTVELWRTADDEICAAVARPDGTRLVFLSGLTNDSGLSFYRDLFGHNGFHINCSGQYDEHSYGPVYNLYYFEEDSYIPILQARCDAHFGVPTILDLDGDGQNELACDRQLFYQRDGQVYCAQVDELLLAACPELGSWGDCTWDLYGRACYATGVSTWTEEKGGYIWKRHIYFDGESLLVYRKEPLTVIDHMVEGADAGVPDEVVHEARDHVQSLLEPQDDGTWLLYDREYENYPIDDWRIVSFSPPEHPWYDWTCLYEFHTPQPKAVVLAGGTYVTEDGWVGPGIYPNR